MRLSRKCLVWSLVQKSSSFSLDTCGGPHLRLTFVFWKQVLHKNQWHFLGWHSPSNAPRGSAPTRRAGNDAPQPRFVSLPWMWQPAAQRLPGERSSWRGRGGQGSTPFPEFPLSASGNKVHPRAAERWESFRAIKNSLIHSSLPLNEESQCFFLLFRKLLHWQTVNYPSCNIILPD